MEKVDNKITLAPLEPNDREQFIIDNLWAFKIAIYEVDCTIR